jgi:hypothetical protein
VPLLQCLLDATSYLPHALLAPKGMMLSVSRSPCVRSPSTVRWGSQEGGTRKPFNRTPLNNVREIPGQTFGPSLLNKKPPPAPLMSVAGLKERLTESYRGLEASLQGINNRTFVKVNAGENEKPEFANYRVQHELRQSTQSRLLDPHIEALLMGTFFLLLAMVWAFKLASTPSPSKDRYSEY